MQSTSLNIALASFSIAPLAEVVSQVPEVALHIYIYIYIYIYILDSRHGETMHAHRSRSCDAICVDRLIVAEAEAKVKSGVE